MNDIHCPICKGVHFFRDILAINIYYYTKYKLRIKYHGQSVKNKESNKYVILYTRFRYFNYYFYRFKWILFNEEHAQLIIWIFYLKWFSFVLVKKEFRIFKYKVWLNKMSCIWIFKKIKIIKKFDKNLNQKIFIDLKQL